MRQLPADAEPLKDGGITQFVDLLASGEVDTVFYDCQLPRDAGVQQSGSGAMLTLT